MENAFILGKTPELSLAELGAFFGNAVRIEQRSGIAFTNKELPMPAEIFMSRLGGTIEILKIVEQSVPLPALESAVIKVLKQAASQKSGKFPFAINLIPENKHSHALRSLLPRIKKTLRAAGVQANFMNNNFQNISRVLLLKERIIEKGANVHVIEQGEGRIAIGLTCAVQNVDEYSARDYEKPFRDAKVGMLPPKLAQMMINLATHQSAPHHSAPHHSAPLIIDPFCGTGTVVMEALLMGFDGAGSDSEARLVEGAKKNIDWLRRARNVSPEIGAKIFEKSVLEISRADFVPFEIEKRSCAIVTEPYLGPPLLVFPGDRALEKIQEELAKLYLDFFKNTAAWAPRGTSIVCIFPFWRRGKNERVPLSERLIARIEALGYSMATFVPLQKTSLFYDRADQIVGREIIRFIIPE